MHTLNTRFPIGASLKYKKLRISNKNAMKRFQKVNMEPLVLFSHCSIGAKPANKIIIKNRITGHRQVRFRKNIS